MSYPPLPKYCPNLTQISVPQARFLLSDCREAIYGGAAGGGKSDALLMGALQYVDVPGYAALILRRTMPELRGADGLLARAHSWLQRTDARWNEQERTWTFPSGATLRFGHVETENDKYKYDGQAYQFVGFDELTSFTESQYDWIGFSRARRTVKVDVPVRTRGTATPTGIGYGWVKRRFITARAPDVVFVPARVWDNPGLNAEEYAASLGRMPEEQRRRLLEGDWDVFEGAAFPMWDDATHVVAPPEIPNEWRRFECMDFGVSNPTAWYVVAVDYDGNLICFDEVYGPNRGADGNPRGGYPSETAPVIVERRKQGWEQRDADGWKLCSNVVWADPSTRNRAPIENRVGLQTSVAQEFSDLGVPLTPANNDRQAGFLRLSELLRLDPDRRFPSWHPLAGESGAPRLYVSRACPNLAEQLQTAPLEGEGKRLYGEAIDEDWEGRHGHAVAALRYGVLSRPSPSREPEPVIEDPRAAMIARRAKERDLAARGKRNDFVEIA